MQDGATAAGRGQLCRRECGSGAPLGKALKTVALDGQSPSIT